jgi:hypothetical protein
VKPKYLPCSPSGWINTSLEPGTARGRRVANGAFRQMRSCSLPQSDAAPRVNHRMPAERHSPTASDETTRESVSVARKAGLAAEKVQEFGPNPTAPGHLSQCNINYLVAGWGARIRTWEWRNQKLQDHIDAAAFSPQLRAKAHILVQRVAFDFPTDFASGLAIGAGRSGVLPGE